MKKLKIKLDGKELSKTQMKTIKGGYDPDDYGCVCQSTSAIALTKSSSCCGAAYNLYSWSIDNCGPGETMNCNLMLGGDSCSFYNGSPTSCS